MVKTSTEPTLKENSSYDFLDEDLPLLPGKEKQGKEETGQENMDSEIENEKNKNEQVPVEEKEKDSDGNTSKVIPDAQNANNQDDTNRSCPSVLGAIAKIIWTAKHGAQEKKRAVKHTMNSSFVLTLALLLLVISIRSLKTPQNCDRKDIVSECANLQHALSSEDGFHSLVHYNTTEYDDIFKDGEKNTYFSYDDAVWAAHYRPSSLLVILSQQPEIVQHVDANDWTVLHEAVQSGNIESVSAVLAFTLNMSDGYERKVSIESAVNLARNLELGLIEKFLMATGVLAEDAFDMPEQEEKEEAEAGDTLGDEHSEESTAIFTHEEAAIAARYYPSLLLSMLSKQPGLIHSTDANNWTLLHEATHYGNIESICIAWPFILNTYGAGQRETLLKDTLWLAQYSQHDKIAVLLKAVATADSENTDMADFTIDEAMLALSQNPPLLIIMLTKHLEFMRNADENGSTLLHEAVRCGKIESVSVVLAFTLSMNIEGHRNHDESALVMAQTLGHNAIAELLVETGVLGAGAPRYGRDIDKEHTFTYEDALDAIFHDHSVLLHAILTQNPGFLRYVDKNGWTLLHEAVRSGNVDSVSAILDIIDDVTYLNMRTTNVGTATWLAILCENKEIAELLKAKGGVELSPEGNDRISEL